MGYMRDREERYRDGGKERDIEIELGWLIEEEKGISQDFNVTCPFLLIQSFHNSLKYIDYQMGYINLSQWRPTPIIFRQVGKRRENIYKVSGRIDNVKALSFNTLFLPVKHGLL